MATEYRKQQQPSQTATGCNPTAEVRDVCIDFLESILTSNGFGIFGNRVLF